VSVASDLPYSLSSASGEESRPDRKASTVPRPNPPGFRARDVALVKSGKEVKQTRVPGYFSEIAVPYLRKYSTEFEIQSL
jgi:hypothetical protein